MRELPREVEEAITYTIVAELDGLGQDAVCSVLSVPPGSPVSDGEVHIIVTWTAKADADGNIPTGEPPGWRPPDPLPSSRAGGGYLVDIEPLDYKEMREGLPPGRGGIDPDPS